MKVAIGVSWQNAGSYDDEIDALIRKTASDQPKLVKAIGACGLDAAPDDAQVGAFARQADIARDLGLVLVVQANGAHSRAFGELERRGFPMVRVVVSSFEGSDEDLSLWVQAGSYVSFGGWQADDPLELCRLVKQVRPDRVLVESGAPDQALDMLAGFPARCDQSVFVADAIRSLVSAERLAANADELYR